MRGTARALVRRTGVYLGLVGQEPTGGSVRVRPARRACLGIARSTAILGASTVVVTVGIFGSDLSDVLVDAAIGTAVWGAVWFVAGARRFVPSRALLPVPRDAVVEHEQRSPSGFALALARGVPICVGLAWAAHRWDSVQLLVLGQLLGMAAAHAVAAALIARWERVHRRFALFREAAGDAELYAASSADGR